MSTQYLLKMLTVRKAKKIDKTTIIDFQVRMAKETEQIDLDRDIVNKGVNAVINSPEKGIYFVAESGNKIILNFIFLLLSFILAPCLFLP